MLPPNTLLRNRYRIFQELGRGGMGAVYQAMDENLNCLVAVKETFATNEQQRRAFKREAELLANLNHPTLPKVSDHFEEGDGQFLVMQYVPGQDLNELLKLSRQPFSVERVVDWADQILVALEELHGSIPPIIHRDIKPSNLKLTPKHKVMLLDFGLAKGVAGQMSTVQATKISSVPGYTLSYAPPEQIRGLGTDARTDLYSLAASLWTLLTAKIPPDAVTRLDEKEKGKPDPLQPVHELNERVPAVLSNLIHRTMALNSDNRPASVKDFRRELQKVSGSEFGRQLRPTVPVPDPKPVSTIPVPPPPVPPPPPPVPHPRDRHGSSGGYGSVIDPPPIDPTDRLSARWILGAVGVLVVAALVFVFFGIGWRPWAQGNTEGPAAQEDRNGAISSNSPSPQNSVSPSPDKPTVQTPSPGSVVRNQIGMELVWIPSGSFVMGSDNGEDDEKPVHQVAISNSFYMSKYEVTQAQWQQVMGSNPSAFQNCASDCPVESVSWEDAQTFIQKLNQLSDSYAYRLPTEAQWEYACRAGTIGDYAGALDSIAWYANNSGNNYFDADRPSQYDAATGAHQYSQQISNNGNRPHRVGTKQANHFGLFDMAGNVSEWCEDTYHGSYVGAPTDGAPWLTGGDRGNRVVRGGAWYFSFRVSRSAYRSGYKSDVRDSRIGFRVAAAIRTK